MERLTSRNEDCVLVNGHALGCATVGEIVQMAERLADFEAMDRKRIRPGARLEKAYCEYVGKEMENWSD